MTYKIYFRTPAQRMVAQALSSFDVRRITKNEVPIDNTVSVGMIETDSPLKNDEYESKLRDHFANSDYELLKVEPVL